MVFFVVSVLFSPVVNKKQNLKSELCKERQQKSNFSKCSLRKTDYKYKKSYSYKVVITAALVKTIKYAKNAIHNYNNELEIILVIEITK